MPAARGVKRTASKSLPAAPSSVPKTKKKRGAIQLEIPSAPTERGRVYTCGQGDVGQLGLGEDVVETNKFKYVPALGDKIVDVCAGGMHTITLDTDGKVWTFGCNDEGALGRATSGDSEEGTPGTVALPRAAVCVTAGDSHSAALLDNGDVFAWGSFRDSHGSMGLVVRGREGKACREPVKVDVGETAVGLASGGDHLAILTTSGAVLTMGCGEQGQLGRLSQRSASRNARQGFSALLVPSKVTLKAGASRIWAGYHATFALDASGEKMFAWGLNNYGQLGITGEKRKTALFSPTECDAFTARDSHWQRVTAGQHHTLALDTAGVVYAIGRREYGRLGLGDRTEDAEALEAIPKLQSKKCISIAAGTCNSFAVTDSGEVYAWGMGSEGQLGTGNSSDATEPTPAVLAALEGVPARTVAAGGQHAVLLAHDPKAQKEASPAPGKVTSEHKTETVTQEKKDSEKTEKKPEKRQTKRQKKQQEQEDEISSTSSAQSNVPAEENKPQKVNGDEKQDIPMEVDETDKAKEKTEIIEESTEKAENKEDTTKSDANDASSQGTDSDTKSQSDTQENETNDVKTGSNDNKTESNDAKPEGDDAKIEHDVEMKDEKAEVNGAPEMEVVESKTVEQSIPTDNTLTTTA